MHPNSYRSIVANAVTEDLGHGDITTDGIFSTETGQGHIVTREDGILAGIDVAAEVFSHVDPELEFTRALDDGTRIKPGDMLAAVSGRISGILRGERVALNFLQRMSGISTITDRAVASAAGTRARITDTRKTTPGLRVLEKYAVRVGGGENHRFGLYDMVLVKDNHIQGAGSIREAVSRVRARAGFAVKIEVETSSLDQVREALACGADVIMLDNMPTDLMRAAVSLIAGKALVEASGGITLDTVSAAAATGVDLISLGCLTHSTRALDIALKLSQPRLIII